MEGKRKKGSKVKGGSKKRRKVNCKIIADRIGLAWKNSKLRKEDITRYASHI